MKRWIRVRLTVGLGLLFVSGVQAASTIVSRGSSAFGIVEPLKAPASIRAAAVELQRNLEAATGARLAIRNDSESITGPFISLGATKQAAAAGISAQNVANEGFRIVTNAGNLFILGPDTAARITTRRDNAPFENYTLQPDLPGPQLTEDGGFSHGTANGVYTFLEDYLGVRWLMPGDLGWDVPAAPDFTIPDLDRVDAPLFLWRDMPYLQNTPAAEQWRVHQKLGFSFRLNFNHNWIETVPPDLYAQHPDWFAMIDGKRMAPPLSGPHRRHYKLETTNPELIRFFGEKAVAALQADPHSNTFSLSSSDSRGWSESPESKALYDPPPPGSEFPSVTPLMLKWYQDVSAVVAKEYPKGKLAGYLYSDGGYPPVHSQMKLPENFTPVITGKDAGYGFYRQSNRDLGTFLIDSWARVAPSVWFYYTFGAWQRSGFGMVAPASPDNLNYTFSLLRRDHIRGARIYGTSSWAQGALTNYIQAKLLWDPRLDATALQHEWLIRAYGPAAGADMEEFYTNLDRWYGEYYRKDESANHNIKESLFQQVYAPHYAELEQSLLTARAREMAPTQRERLQLIEETLRVLQWRLRNAGYLPESFISPLAWTNQEVEQALFANNSDFNHFGRMAASTPPVTPIKVQLGTAPKGEFEAGAPNAHSVLIYAARDGDIRLTASDVHPGSSFLTYTITEASNERGQVQTGLLYDQTSIRLQAHAGTAYYFYAGLTGIDISPQATWTLTVPGAGPAVASGRKGSVYLQGAPAAVYVSVPAELPISMEQVSSWVVLRSKGNPAPSLDGVDRLFPGGKSLQDLSDDWRYSPAPAEGWPGAGFDDQQWKAVSTAEGLPPQRSSAPQTLAFRKSFVATKVAQDQLLFLYVGAVDGDAVIYLNGRKVGEHLQGDQGDHPFGFDITSMLVPGRNSIAVQVTNAKHATGILKDVHLLVKEDSGTF